MPSLAPDRGSPDLTILIPSSLTEETRDRRIKTYKVGQIARAASVFRVEKIIIYRDPKFDDSRFIDLLLRYAETPQYLRKHLFPLQEELKHAGVLPPLRTLHHPIESRSSNLNEGEFRVGVVVPGPQKKKSEKKVGSDKSAWVDIGIDSPVRLEAPSRKVRTGERVNVRIFSRRPIQAKLVTKDEIPMYWGYRTAVEDSLSGALEKISEEGALIIATSRQGKLLDNTLLAQIGDQTKQSKYTAVVFGSPRQGIETILADEGFKLSDFHCEVLNTIPGQGTATVRTEEAVWATLSALNLVR
ncbi:MAG: RNA methyltransferase [Methanosarcinales archaeon]|nr:RNA methyltransferase [Methanosarcinales archaeon]